MHVYPFAVYGNKWCQKNKVYGNKKLSKYIKLKQNKGKWKSKQDAFSLYLEQHDGDEKEELWM